MKLPKENTQTNQGLQSKSEQEQEHTTSIL